MRHQLIRRTPAGTRDPYTHGTHVANVIERPAALDNMTAKQNLRLERMLLRGGEKSDLDALLQLVHLGPEAVGHAPLRGFSLGMRQRCGLAAALLGEPEMLVLDEPGTGLDPEGMRALSALLAGLNREKGTTILISSHILHALYEIATDFIVLDHGKIIKQMTHAQLEKELKNAASIEEYYLDLIGKGTR